MSDFLSKNYNNYVILDTTRYEMTYQATMSDFRTGQ